MTDPRFGEVGLAVHVGNAVLKAISEAHAVNKPQTCAQHEPKQHRDGLPPWCKRCGRGENGGLVNPLVAPDVPDGLVEFALDDTALTFNGTVDLDAEVIDGIRESL